MLKRYLSVLICLIFVFNSYTVTVSAETVLVTENFSKYTADISSPWNSLMTDSSVRDMAV